MRILLYGEFSGVHSSLKYGLESLGHEVHLVTSGDGFKAFSGNVVLRARAGGAVARGTADFWNASKLMSLRDRYDVVQFVNPRPGVVTPRLGIEARIVQRMQALADRSFYYVCGCDSTTFAAFERKPAHFASLCRGCLRDNGTKRCLHLVVPGYRASDARFVESVDGIIVSTSGAYRDQYVGHPRFLGEVGFPIRIPIEADEIVRPPRSVLHGINRRFTKGSDVLLPVLQGLAGAGEIRLEQVSGLPFAEYIKRVRRNRFVVDQLYGDSLGMNALFAMANGALAITRFEAERFPGAPAIGLMEDPIQIRDVVREAAAMSDREFSRLQAMAREYVREHHDSTLVASRFVELWNSK